MEADTGNTRTYFLDSMLEGGNVREFMLSS